MPIGVAFGTLGAAWLAWGFAHPDRKVLNLILMIGLFALYAVTVALVSTLSKGKFNDERMHVVTAVTFLVVAAFFAFTR